MPIDYNRYPKDWKQTVERIRERSGDKCEKCDLKNGSTAYSVPFDLREGGRYKTRRLWFRSYMDAKREAAEIILIKAVKVVLTVAHLDHDEENHDVKDERLMHMCQVCHLRYDAEEKYRRSFRDNRTKTST
jgi:hypothetical protein